MAINVHQDRSLFEDIRESNEFEKSEDFNEGKLKEYQDTALSRVTNAANDTADTGLREVFTDLGLEAESGRLPRRVTPEALVNHVSEYVEQIIEGSFEDIVGNLTAPTSSIAANIDRQVLANSANDVRDEIFNEAEAGNRSLSAVNTIQDFNTSVLQPEVLNEYAKVEKQNKEFINKFDALEKKWYRPRRNKKIRRAHKYDELNKGFREKLDKQFSEWNTKAKEIESDQERKIQVTQRMIEHKISHGTEDERNQRATALMYAVRYGATNLNFDLSRFYPGGASEQQKIEFLEAANRIDWITEGITASKILEKNSATIEKQLEVGKEIEDLIRDEPIFFKVRNFEALKSDEAFLVLPEINDTVTEKELVADLKHGLEFQKENIPAAFQDYMYGDLLDDEPKLMVFLEYIWSNANIRKNLPEITRAKILKWFEQLEGETTVEIYDQQTEVENLQKELQEKNSSIPKKARQFSNKLKKLKVSDDETSFKNLQKDALSFSALYSQKQQEFENIKSNLPEKDAQELSEAWDKIKELQEFFVKTSAEWIKNKKAHDTWKKTNKIAKDKEEEAKKEHDRLVIASPHAKKSKLESIENHAARAANRLKEAQEKYRESVEAEPTLTDISVEFAKYSQIIPTLEKKKFETTKNKTPRTLDLYKRAQQKLFKNFNEQKLEQQLLKNLQKETDIEVVKKAAPRSKLQVTYTEQVPTSFGDIENGKKTATMRVVYRDEKGLYLEEDGTGTSKRTMKIAMNPVYGEGETLSFAENMELGKKSTAGGPRQYGTALNFKLVA